MFSEVLPLAEVPPLTLRRAGYIFQLSAQFSRHGDPRWEQLSAADIKGDIP